MYWTSIIFAIMINVFLNTSYEIEDAGLNPMQEAFTVEAIHAAAFANNTVGLPKICPGKLNTKLLKAIYAKLF